MSTNIFPAIFLKLLPAYVMKGKYCIFSFKKSEHEYIIGNIWKKTADLADLHPLFSSILQLTSNKTLGII